MIYRTLDAPLRSLDQVAQELAEALDSLDPLDPKQCAAHHKIKTRLANVEREIMARDGL